MKIEEIRGKTDNELEVDIAKMKRELFDLRFNANTGTDANTARISVVRRTIAQVNTILHERKLGIRDQAPQV